MNYLKKIQRILALSLWSVLTLSAYGSAPMTVVESQYVYMEVYPKTPTTLIFEKVGACEGDDIHIHKFNSVKDYPSASTIGKQKVKILNIYAISSSPKACEGGRRTIQRKLFFSITQQNTTHFHIVFSKELKLDISHFALLETLL